MLSIILVLSFSIVSLILFALAAVYWLPLWRNRKVGIAHCLFLTNAFLAAIALLRILQAVSFFISGENGDGPFCLFFSFVLLCVAVVQYALSKGYFTVQE